MARVPLARPTSTAKARPLLKSVAGGSGGGEAPQVRKTRAPPGPLTAPTARRAPSVRPPHAAPSTAASLPAKAAPARRTWAREGPKPSPRGRPVTPGPPRARALGPSVANVPLSIKAAGASTRSRSGAAEEPLGRVDRKPRAPGPRDAPPSTGGPTDAALGLVPRVARPPMARLARRRGRGPEESP